MNNNEFYNLGLKETVVKAIDEMGFTKHHKYKNKVFL